MRYILFHAERIRYTTRRKALRKPPDPPGEYETGPAVVVFLTVEEGDDERVLERAASDILDYTVNKVREERIVLYPYAHLSSRLARPPKAHALLVRLEQLLRERFPGEVHRAPFGWYKEFQLHVKGHPLSELSRTIEPEPPVVLGDLTLETLEDATGAGLLPEGVRAELKLEGLAAEKADLLGLSCERREALHYMWRIVRLAEKFHGTPIRRITSPPSGSGLWRLLQAYSIALASPPVLVLGSCPLESVVAVPPGLDLEEAIAAAGVGGGLEWSSAGSARLLLYRPASGGGPVPLGAATSRGTVLGPAGNIVAAVLDYQASLVGKGETPVMPVWLHPITATIIPAGMDALDYARSAAWELARQGATVAILEPSIGVGARIRWSGKRWVPYVLVVGEREMRTGTVTVRRRWRTGEQESVPLPQLAEEVGAALRAYGAAGLVWSVDIREQA